MTQWLFVVEILSLSLAILMLTALPLMLLACSDDESGLSDDVATTAQAATSSCSPDPPYDTCHEVDLDQLTYWQDDLHDPDWRDVEPAHDPDVDFEVSIDAFELNGGVIPTQAGQGDYEDEDEFFKTVSSLLGVNVTSNVVVVDVQNSSVKYTTQQEPTGASTGDFLQDALTNDDGEIWIDHQDRTDDFIDHNRHHGYSQSVEPASSSSQTTNDLEEDLAAPKPSSSSGFIEDTETLDNGQGWTAELRISFVPEKKYVIIPELVDIRYQGNECDWIWVEGPAGFDIARYHCYDVKKLILETETHHADGTTFIEDFMPDVPVIPEGNSHSMHYFNQPAGRACTRGYYAAYDNSGFDDGYVKTDNVPSWADCDDVVSP